MSINISFLIGILVSNILINNYVLSRFLGICPFVGVSKSISSALGMGFAVIFVMTLTAAVTWPIQQLLIHWNIEYMQTVTFILVIAALVQLVEMVIQKTSPVLYSALGIYLPLITTNCAVLAVAILNITDNLNFLESIVQGFAGGAGFTLALFLMSGIRERLELADIPESLKGMPIAFIISGLMSIAFLGFSGMSFAK